MSSLSGLIYPAYPLDIPDILNKRIHQDNFIWKMKDHYVMIRDTVKPAEEEDINTIDFDPMNGTIKLKWLQNRKGDFLSKIFRILGLSAFHPQNRITETSSIKEHLSFTRNGWRKASGQ